MKTIKMKADFDGYPQGDHEGSKRQTFTIGQVVEVNNTFADLVVQKGLGVEVDAAPAAEESETSTAKARGDSPNEAQRSSRRSG